MQKKEKLATFTQIEHAYRHFFWFLVRISFFGTKLKLFLQLLRSFFRVANTFSPFPEWNFWLQPGFVQRRFAIL
jgi:hypothetical protein